MAAIREDAVKYRDRYIVPTTEDTVWVSTWDEFYTCGGHMTWSEDQTEIELTLPVGHKFSIQFMRQAISSVPE